MQILHFEFKLIQDNYVELRYFENNPNQYQNRSLALQEIGDLIELAERDYYNILRKHHTKTERRLFKQIYNPSQLAKGNYKKGRGQMADGSYVGSINKNFSYEFKAQ